MKILYIVAFLFLSFELPAQTPLQGVVVNKDTKESVADVIVQYGNTSGDYVITNEKGYFRIPETSSDTIYFQCIGYRPTLLFKKKLEKHAIVEMELNPLTLNPIVISPESADKLLEQAVLNTKKNLLTDTPISYLLHFVQTVDGGDLKNEAYLKYIAKLNARDLKRSIKEEKIPYVFNLVDVAWLSRFDIPTSDLYGAEYHASHLFTFGRSENNETKLSYTSDSSLMLLEIEPLEGKAGWARGQMYINRADMTVVSMHIESDNAVLDGLPYRNYLGKKYKAVKKMGNFEFKKRGNKYYMSACYTLYRFRSLDTYGIEQEFQYTCNISPVSFVDRKSVLKRQLSGYCQELFYLPNTTKADFWNEPVSEDLAF